MVQKSQVSIPIPSHHYVWDMNSNNKSPLELDRERVTCLLLINTQLMKKTINIYHNVLSNQHSLQQLPQQARKTIIDLYQNCTRRIHCNLTVLSYLHEKYHGAQGQQQTSQNRPTFPVLNTAPPDMPELNQLYNKLQELYPESQYMKMRPDPMREPSQFELLSTSPYPQAQRPQYTPPINNVPQDQIAPRNISVSNMNAMNADQAPNTFQQGQNYLNNFNQGVNNLPNNQIPSQSPRPSMQAMSPLQLFNINNSSSNLAPTSGMMDMI
ncbi:uncharacterized protein PRCAT00001561001 [Priceomyces carsonii]|uniref:uncharacterized protein n=1 Tax=Priceomyces carsonii TaxID=28549 RepID=UPI002ED9828F|nr:unnamed protein product [Priceomyces carsonii]